MTKDYSTVKARILSKYIPYSEYDKAFWDYELLQIDKVRYIIVQILSEKGNLKYSLIITDISDKEMNAIEIFHFYNKHQTIEFF
ncbi:hypothetical protein CPAST_c06620 [Clostridium pasteurianum DSM 525 = ATCC 6013]|uniref:Transposase n=1 Tax=Clostridium pasteurianum DSM 525 = ATCC 6013 TaxID=1262449 RepID=A0A0H3J206_CLOPA|nr:hypothetical protein [Clostridium pasteurianum]AJA46762.1 hypothetical protein CPAST_c06620 [Clostridium pasteurianum DSM 525 = ATCC 6013]AJA50750.1 hypothetical protein CLPA_c06620 [Clostridium pasteurianum DSM 525 = ATCC 6013]AOZ74156.1 hypothetical protein AQ983_03175 [Clostridium pasteurianum DSM 525 = ATCC 6013]AOZ77953.1 hypothetical protein AQ984_03175 [Clostridium pasteurianum]ELP58628.1 hypothetical protein F502_14150 [Clostridium pasteurianum DSM 525 = ATCC 6013]